MASAMQSVEPAGAVASPSSVSVAAVVPPGVSWEVLSSMLQEYVGAVNMCRNLKVGREGVVDRDGGLWGWALGGRRECHIVCVIIFVTIRTFIS
jgi:hypothetical protein